MTLAEISDGASVYIDSNILIYHFLGRSIECRTFLARIERGAVRGFIGPTGVLEVAHRLMIFEAGESGLVTTPNPAAQLARHPEAVRRLSRYYFDAVRIARMHIEILPLPADFLTASQEFRQSHGLLVNDSLIPMHMRQADLANLASADRAFDGLPGVRRFTPADV